jgi:hypothetical protein
MEFKIYRRRDKSLESKQSLKKLLKNSTKLEPIEVALCPLKTRLAKYEHKYAMTSEEFHKKVYAGELEESVDFISWLGDYEQFMRLLQKAKFSAGKVSLESE